jgi:hypothetical protein
VAKNKKKRKRPPAPRPEGQRSPGGGSATPTTKRERRDAARERKQKEIKADARRGAFRRAAIGGVVGLLVFVGFSYFQGRAPNPTPLSDVAKAAARAGGCADLVSPAASAPGGLHLQGGQSYTYDQHPATSGYHDPTPLPGQPRVYTTADLANYHETMAVHSLEHGSVIMYYRPTGDQGGLSQPVVDKLAPIAQNNRASYLIPYPDLAQGTALAFTAWNKLLTCPAKITPDQAATVAQGFIDSFACTNNAPEGNRGDGC